MTVTAEHSPLAELAEEELLSALVRNRESEDESLIEHPLLLAALMRRRHEHGGERLLEHPLLLALLMRRGEHEGGMGNPELAAALLGRR